MQNVIHNKREPYVDIVKGFAIIAVVIFHIDFFRPEWNLFNIVTFFSSWHVPVFFLIGGFFLKEEKLLQPLSFFKSKLKSLYLPALYIYLPATLLHNVFFAMGWYSSDVSYGGKMITEWSAADYVSGILKTLFCAGREPIMGAMWFVYVLLFALCGLSIISFLCKRVTHSVHAYEWLRGIVLVIVTIASCILSNIFDFTIPRFSNVFAAMLLIYTGMKIRNDFKWNFDNKYIALLALLIVYQYSILGVKISLNNNIYPNVIQLIVFSISALYVLCFIAKLISDNVIGKIVELCGKESFYIMGLHFVAFKLCSMLLLSIGLITGGGLSAVTTPALGNNIILIVVYAICGVFIPIGIVRIFRYCVCKITIAK